MIVPSDALLAYTPSAGAVMGVASVIVSLVCGGFALTRFRSRMAAWGLAIVALVATLFFVDHEPAGARMVAIVTTMFMAMKAVVASHMANRLTFPQWIAFTLWPGMRPSIFASLGQPPRDGAGRMAREGLVRCAAGMLLLLVARCLALVLPPEAARLSATPFLLVGLSLILHFGLLNLNAAFWRTCGVPAERLFRDPLHATSLADFWGRRWNLGFTEMTAVVVHRPLRKLAGDNVAILMSFLASGLLHELAISVPARGGYGLPTLYFAIQGILVLRDTKSRALMFVALIAPILLVFHLPFLRTVIWPLAGIR